MKPFKGKCVFRSYGSVPCPPAQAGDCCKLTWLAQWRGLANGITHAPAPVVVRPLDCRLPMQVDQAVNDIVVQLDNALCSLGHGTAVPPPSLSGTLT